MPTDTPAAIDSTVLAFCGQIVPGAVPLYVDVAPGAGARVGYCFTNAREQVERAGGSIAYGWAIWRWPGRFLEAEHHGIWRRPDGGLLDVTPMAFGQMRILFLPDQDAVFDPARFRPNPMMAEPGSAMAEEYIALAREREAILLRYGEPGEGRPFVTGADAERLAVIEPRWMALYQQMSEGE